MRTTKMLMVGAVLGTLVIAAAAQAEDKTAKPAQQGSSAPQDKTAKAADANVITAQTVKVVLRPPLPQAATEVQKLTVARPLPELKQQFLDRTEKAIDKSPF